ncbi:hypothetical protein E2C01_038652 [Portunus trituberculatus]|uniref:Uncharacterized protein n=1 Tax=Portunus trituberculatus TaxID=210409 RepID=A0A5B7FBD3_PORTR|nr:hypothetical protein [Portunus trituberculatus]
MDHLSIGDGDYNVWFRNRTRKQGGGVILLVKKDLMVDSAMNGEGKGREIENLLKRNMGKHLNIIVIYVALHKF